MSGASLFVNGAFLTTAALGLDVAIEVLLTVVVEELLARLDAAQGEYENAPARAVGLAVRLAGVVDIASEVPLHVPVNGLAIDVEEVLALVVLSLLLAYGTPNIFDNAGALRNKLLSIQAEPGLRPAGSELVVAGSVLALACHGRATIAHALCALHLFCERLDVCGEPVHHLLAVDIERPGIGTLEEAWVGLLELLQEGE